MDKDLLGNPTSEVEREVLALYGGLKELVGRADIPPCVARNAKKALACLWQSVTDLGLDYEQLPDLGV